MSLLASKSNTLEFSYTFSPIACGTDIYILEFSDVLNSNAYKSSEMSDPTPLGLTTY